MPALDNNILNLECDFIGIIILIVILINSTGSVMNSIDNRLFKRFTLIITSLLALESLCYIVNGANFTWAREMNILFNTIYYLLEPFVGYIWIMYVDYKVFDDENALKRRKILYMIPIIVSIMMTLSNFKTHVFFTITEDNFYMRSPVFWISMLLVFIYCIIAFILLLYGRSKTTSIIDKREYLYLSTFAFFPVSGAVIQGLVYGMSLIWPMAMVSVTMLYMTVQGRIISTDALTGITERRQFYKLLKDKINTRTSDELIYLISIDIDNFKSINDTYGHSTGDDALISFAQILTRACSKKTDIAARIAGDEFAVMCVRKENSAPDDVIIKANRLIAEQNDSGKKKYKLHMSAGYAYFGSKKTTTLDALIAEADNRMYIEKKNKKVGR